MKAKIKMKTSPKRYESGLSGLKIACNMSRDKVELVMRENPELYPDSFSEGLLVYLSEDCIVSQDNKIDAIESARRMNHLIRLGKEIREQRLTPEAISYRIESENLARITYGHGVKFIK